jgi:hypothetical protein
MYRTILMLVISTITVCTSHASVVSSTTSGFVIKHSVVVKKSPDAAFESFASKVQDWWDPAHTYTGKSENVSIDLKPNGCFCERLGPQGFVVHMTLTYSDPGKLLRMTGALGPVQQFAATGVMTLEFQPMGGDTLVNFTYSVAGDIPNGADKLAPVVDRVLVGQMNRFERFVNTGRPI